MIMHESYISIVDSCPTGAIRGPCSTRPRTRRPLAVAAKDSKRSTCKAPDLAVEKPTTRNAMHKRCTSHKEIRRNKQIAKTMLLPQ